jgi:hypothetical protein
MKPRNTESRVRKTNQRFAVARHVPRGRKRKTAQPLKVERLRWIEADTECGGHKPRAYPTGLILELQPLLYPLDAMRKGIQPIMGGRE